MLRYLTLLVCLWGVYQRAESANCHMREIDLCVATVLLSAADGIPTNDEEMDRSCEPIQEGIECVSNYSATCFTPLLQEVFDSAIASVKESQNKLCTAGTEERATYFKNAPCMEKIMSPEKLKPDVDDLLAALEKATEAKFNDRIPILCCGAQRLFAAAIKTVETECGKEILEDGDALAGMPIAGLSGMFCTGYEPGSPKCANRLPPSGTPFNGADSNNQLIRLISSAMATFT